MQDLLERDWQAHEAGPVLRVIPGRVERHKFGIAAWAFLVALAVAAMACNAALWLVWGW